jgi:hypothetical protein
MRIRLNSGVFGGQSFRVCAATDFVRSRLFILSGSERQPCRKSRKINAALAAEGGIRESPNTFFSSGKKRRSRSASAPEELPFWWPPIFEPGWRLVALILVIVSIATAQAAYSASQSPAAQVPSNGTTMIDGIAARIDTDVITESEVRELAGFQMLVDGASKSRDELIRELSDQWIVRGEADAARFPHPSDNDVDTAYADLVKQFPSPAEFEKRCAAASLTEDAVRRQLSEQLYLSRFLDFRFRPAAEIDDAAVQKYYDEQFAPQLKAKGESVPPLDKVKDTIREVLVQQAINDRANQWLDDTRARLEIDVLPQGAAQ